MYEKIKIPLVDDNPINQEAAPGQPRRLGNDAGVAADGLEALEAPKHAAHVGQGTPDDRLPFGAAPDPSGEGSEPLVIAGETPPVDLERLGEVSEGDPDRIAQLIDLYLTQADEIMAGLRTAIDAGSVEDVGRLAHKLAGASATCGMAAIMPPLRELEGQAKQGNLSGAGRAVARAGEELETMRRFLKGYR